MGKLNAREEEPWATGDELISPDQAIEYALTGIDVHELRENERFGKALEGADPVTPILVERLDEADVFYYLVPMAREEALTSVFSVHGRYGNFEGGQAFEVEADRSFFDLDQVIERILKTAIEVDPDRYPDQIKVLAAIEAGDFDLQPVRVWKPCLESRSPYYPFSVITIGDSTFYVGYNGVIYSELHDFGPGG